MPFWKPLKIGSDEYSLSHLEPFIFSVIPKHQNVDVNIYVRFNDHCFTENFDPKKHSEELKTTTSSHHERRAFCPIRYELSKNLPDLIRALDGRRISQTRNGDLVRVEMAGGRSYGIFFTLRREGPNSCRLFVMSAYPFASDRKVVAVTGEMKFNVAVALVLQGKAPKFPPRN